MKERRNAIKNRILPSLKKIRFTFRIFIVSAYFIFSTGGYLNLRNMPIPRNAYITGNEIVISTQISGRIAQVHSPNTDWVQKGDLLLSLDNTQAMHRYRKAEDKLTETNKKKQARYVIDAENNTRILHAQMVYQQALNDYHRRIQSKGTYVISQKDLQQSLKPVDSSKKALDVAIRKYRQIQQRLQASDISQQEMISQAINEFQEAIQALKNTEIRSPVSGYVTQRNILESVSITSGQALMTVVPADQTWVNAKFEATRLSGLFLGQKVSIVTELYGPKVIFNGQIEGIVRDTETALPSLFTPKKSESWVNEQQILVQISIDPLQLSQHPLRPGSTIRYLLM